jgi:hypothetical protein
MGASNILVRGCSIPETLQRQLACFFSAKREEACVWLSWLLLLLVAVELVTMPLTQHLWVWDGFVHSGQDFELGLFMIVVCVCLTLLRAQHGRLCVSLLLAVCHWLGEAFRRGLWPGIPQVRGLATATGQPPRTRIHDNLTTPLLI